MKQLRPLLNVAAMGVFLLIAMEPYIAFAAEDSVIVSARFYPTPGREAEAEALMLKVVAFDRAAEPNAMFRLHRSLKEPEVLFFYEVYPSAAARETHVKSTLPALAKQFEPPPEGLFARPPEIEAFRELTN